MKIISVANNLIINAQFGGVNAPGNTGRFSNIGGFAQGVIDVINAGINVSGLVAVGILVYSGIMMIVANGEPEKIDKATNGVTGSIIGLIIIFISKLIISFVLDETGKLA